jgi:hypothetical protein
LAEEAREGRDLTHLDAVAVEPVEGAADSRYVAIVDHASPALEVAGVGLTRDARAEVLESRLDVRDIALQGLRGQVE